MRINKESVSIYFICWLSFEEMISLYYNLIMIKAVFFDFGGVIYEHPKAVIPEVVARIYNVPIEKANEEYQKYRIDYYLGKIPTDELITSLSSA